MHCIRLSIFVTKETGNRLTGVSTLKFNVAYAGFDSKKNQFSFVDLFVIVG